MPKQHYRYSYDTIDIFQNTAVYCCWFCPTKSFLKHISRPLNITMGDKPLTKKITRSCF